MVLPKINYKFLILGALLAQSSLADRAKVYRKCNKPGQIALTFDDGPNPNTTPKALEVLEKYNIKGTFFINGKNWSNLNEQPEAVEVVKKAYAAGHEIGSHTYDHRDLFTAMDEGSLQHNVDEMTDKIESIIGVRPAYFRPPEGKGGYEESDPTLKEKSKKIQEYLGERGYSVIMWGADTNDWKYREDTDSVFASLNEQLAAPGVSSKTDSFIVLFHDVYDTTVNLNLPNIIEYLQSLNYTFVPLSECIGVPAYQAIDNNDDNGKGNLNNNNNQNGNESNNGSNKGSSNESNNGNKSDNNTQNTNNSKTKDASSDATTLKYSFFLTIATVLYSLVF